MTSWEVLEGIFVGWGGKEGLEELYRTTVAVVDMVALLGNVNSSHRASLVRLYAPQRSGESSLR